MRAFLVMHEAADQGLIRSSELLVHVDDVGARGDKRDYLALRPGIGPRVLYHVRCAQASRRCSGFCFLRMLPSPGRR